MSAPLNSDELLEAIKAVFRIQSVETYFEVRSVEIAGSDVLVLFEWANPGVLYGVRIEIPDTTDHQSWQEWCPQTLEEWATYAVKWRMLEELETGLLGRTSQSFDGHVTWLELPE
ncbi:hypothetical protein [Arthrobacter sp. CAN_C5]|uniref:hypothetical protein n=1 Tax=Arthrobacter sp. CAN_C5 TaxID=2760706 RepID=UPI001AE6D9D2|nr:hypothetical protein [Arthrobacter sp. CAN_C5]MBP2216559.1 hypothetical protein [Arthrobacter sp. CAN_C5]